MGKIKILRPLNINRIDFFHHFRLCLVVLFFCWSPDKRNILCKFWQILVSFRKLYKLPVNRANKVLGKEKINCGRFSNESRCSDFGWQQKGIIGFNVDNNLYISRPVGIIIWLCNVQSWPSVDILSKYLTLIARLEGKDNKRNLIFQKIRKLH